MAHSAEPVAGTDRVLRGSEGDKGVLPAPTETLAARVLSLQRAAGNSAVLRVLARYAGDDKKLAPASTKGGSRKGRVDVPSATVYGEPGGPAIGALPAGAPVRVLSTSGDLLTI